MKLMKNLQSNIENNYYTVIDNTKICVDNVSERVKILNSSNISVQSLKKIICFASSQQMGKIICNSDIENSELLIEAGFCVEGKIDGFFKGKDALCMSYFIDSKRKVSIDSVQKDILIDRSLNIQNTYSKSSNNISTYSIRTAMPKDIGQIIELFSTVFSTYPSPVYDENFIKETMNGKVLYKVAVLEGKIIGIASADMDTDNLNAEITDCATYPEHRGKGILSNIIYQLEEDLKKMDFITLYSLSRSINPGINMVLSKHNYKYTGRLINNCNICGAFEDMNIWTKNISSR